MSGIYHFEITGKIRTCVACMGKRQYDTYHNDRRWISGLIGDIDQRLAPLT
jgi:hypothetical protein